jgi:hypothetical protein
MQLMLNPDLLAPSEHEAPDFDTVTVAEADLVGSSTEVALTTPIPAAVAVNIPLLSTVPTAPVDVQVTPRVEPVTFAVNCCLPPTPRVMLAGLIETEIAPPPPPPPALVTVTWAVADFVGSSTEVAVTVPVPADTAVYNPVWSTFPALVALHVTPLVEPETFATNVWVPPGVKVAVVGAIVTLIVEATKLPTR